MRMGLNLTQQLTMKWMLKPELQMSLHILQLSNYELMQYLSEQANENPVLEVEAPSPLFRVRKTAGSAAHGEWQAISGRPARKDTPEQELLSQLRIAGIPAGLYPIAAFLAGNLDESGYLRISTAETVAILNRPKELVEEALQFLQAMEPAGVGARNLLECLLLQIERDPLAPAGAYELVNGCLELLAQGKFDKIGLHLGIAVEEVKRIAAYIRELNPRPWSASGGEDAPYVVPDAFIGKEEAAWVIRLNAGAIPRLTVNQQYAGSVLASGNSDAAAFIKDKVKMAASLAFGLKQRQVTLYRVIHALFSEQSLFLEHGDCAIKPMTLRVLSERLQVHESTVSRAVQGKFVRTPFGLYELKFFFSSGLQTTAGDYASAKQIKNRIKQLVAEESKRQPLSDQKIVDILTREGIHISRRTVTKYREELHLLSSALRKNIL